MTEASEKPATESGPKLNPEVGKLLDELPLGSRLFATPEAIQKIAKQEDNPSDENPWYDYYNDIQAYETTFRDVLGETHIVDYLQGRKKQEKGAVVLDLMGPGFVLRSLPYDAALAVTLGDRRVQEQKDIDTQKDLTVIAGDVRKSWDRVKEWLNKHEVVGFDLILCRPLKGYDTLPRDNETYYSLLQSIWEVLNKDEGMLLFEVPGYKQRTLSSWAKRISRIPGVKTNFKENLLIIKEAIAPDKII